MPPVCQTCRRAHFSQMKRARCSAARCNAALRWPLLPTGLLPDVVAGAAWRSS